MKLNSDLRVFLAMFAAIPLAGMFLVLSIVTIVFVGKYADNVYDRILAEQLRPCPVEEKP